MAAPEGSRRTPWEFPLHTANTLCQGLRIDQMGNEQAGPQGLLPWCAPSHAEQYARPNGSCLPLPTPNTNRKTPHGKLKSVSSLMLVQEGLLLKYILRPRRTKEYFPLDIVPSGHPANISLEAAFGHLTWWVQTPGHLVDELPWSISPSSP